MDVNLHETRSRRRRWGGVAVAIALVALAAACSGDDDGDQLADTESINSTESANQSGPDGASEQTDEDSGSESADSDGGEVLGTSRATHQASAADHRATPIRLDLVRLERSGELVELTLTLTNEVDPETDDDDPQAFTAWSMFSGSYGGPGVGDARGLGLVDDEAQKMYLAVLDGDDVCLCTNNLNNEQVLPGGSMTINATFGGLPEDVEQVDVYIPNFPTISGITIQ